MVRQTKMKYCRYCHTWVPDLLTHLPKCDKYQRYLERRYNKKRRGYKKGEYIVVRNDKIILVKNNTYKLKSSITRKIIYILREQPMRKITALKLRMIFRDEEWNKVRIALRLLEKQGRIKIEKGEMTFIPKYQLTEYGGGMVEVCGII